ncbi:YicC family protein [Acutalibacter muris]|uniref:YicC family protein n=1 Tax=Acutalibacter muris TaxID=1796620 RepID=A0A1Z2XPJ2_9FIRM|nr:YicC/YloC family endoribonuclease [Acutalibacter muris]ANU52962.1 YicC family protein [Hungateiclostridiaceae bacterium KB18]ASB40362.1 YicC family protein [Acutalibacter muris]QQR29653.1 YicC family protein [Acutalibacter muris]
MLKSMTGYGRGEGIVETRHIVFELKSVNHKFFEINPRVTRGYQFLEDRLKTYLHERISRGKVDLFLQIENLGESSVEVGVNHSLAAGYYRALSELQERYSLPDGPSLELLCRYQDIFTVHKAPEEETVWRQVLEIAAPTVDSFLRMREAEGERLRADIMEKAGNILSLVDKVEELAPGTVAEYRERLQGRIQELLSDSRFDEQRVLTEVAVFADKVAVDEETVRLRSHFAQLEKLANSDGPVGRKIDFLVQEMNREANTIGSKSQNTEIAYLVVDIKSEIEKIREQVQNIE